MTGGKKKKKGWGGGEGEIQKRKEGLKKQNKQKNYGTTALVVLKMIHIMRGREGNGKTAPMHGAVTEERI